MNPAPVRCSHTLMKGALLQTHRAAVGVGRVRLENDLLTKTSVDVCRYGALAGLNKFQVSAGWFLIMY